MARSVDRASAVSPGASMASLGGAGHTVGRVSVLSMIFNILIIVLLTVAVFLIYNYAQPYQRGFFCDDDSIRYSLKGDTVTAKLLIPMCVCVPIVVVITCEAVAAAMEGPAAVEERLALGRVMLPVWIARSVWTLFVLFFGMAAQDVLSNAAKFSVGRLRPHFLAACEPSPPLSVLCGANATQHAYVTTFRCTGSARVTRNARLSFPSGHSSMSFYAAVFTALYVGRRFHWRRRARLQLAFGQVVLVLLAWLTALSRVSDHKHHWSDVLVGSALGALMATLTALFLLYRLKRPADRAGDAAYIFEETPPDAVQESLPGAVEESPPDAVEKSPPDAVVDAGPAAASTAAT